MHKTYSFRGVVAAAVLASVLSVSALWLAHTLAISPSPAFAEGPTSPDVVLYAMPRGSEGKDESFIFYKAETGDIWVYRDYKFREHYRLTKLGVDMENEQ